MPRDLSDVLHYFIPEEERRPRARTQGSTSSRPPPRSPISRARGREPGAAPAPQVLALPIGERDVLRAAFAWNLAIELSRRGESASILTPFDVDPGALWPEIGRPSLGVEIALAAAEEPEELAREVARARSERESGLLFVRLPSAWLQSPRELAPLLDWTLLFASPERRDLLEAYALAKRILEVAPGARVGVAIHGVRRVGQARRAFEQLAYTSERHLGLGLRSYGLIVDDLHIYRSIVGRRPVAISGPQSPAAKSLADVARLLAEDARLASEEARPSASSTEQEGP